MATKKVLATAEEPVTEEVVESGVVVITEAPDGVGVIEKVDDIQIHVTERAGGGTNRVYL